MGNHLIDPGAVADGPERRAQSEDGRRRRALFDLLHGLERGSVSGVLRLHADGDDVGRVVAREGRICLALVHDEATRVRSAPPSPAGDGVASARLGQLARQARDEGTSFCAAVLRLPEAEVVPLRAELCRETAVALRTLAEACCRRPVQRDLERARADYDPRLTFSAAELYCAAIRLDEAPGQDAVTELFHGFQPSGQAGVLLAREPGQEPMPYPIASYGLSEASLQHLLSLSRCAGELMRPSTFMGAVVEPTYAVLRGDVGEHWVCVAGGRHLALIERREGADPAPVIAQTLRSN
jgi:hypothetical protein